MARGRFVRVLTKTESKPEEDVEVPTPKLAENDIDLPDEPEEIELWLEVWDKEGEEWALRPVGTKTLVPTGCERAEFADPYDSCPTLKSALPRDKEKDSNLYAMWQTNGWISRRWAQEKLDEGIDHKQLDKEIADDIPFLLAIKGMADKAPGAAANAQVAQTPGMSPGSAEAGITPTQAGAAKGD